MTITPARPRPTPGRAVLLVLAAIALAGCGLSVQQRAAVQKFSAATVDFAELASTEFTKSRTDVIAMNTMRVELGDRDASVDALDDLFTVGQVKTRLDTLGALSDYATLLHTLVTSSQEEALRNASDSMVASLRKVNGVTLTDDKAAAISAAVQKVGGLLIEYMRAEAVQDVVTRTHPVILEVIQLVRDDFSKTADQWKRGYVRTAQALTGAAELAARHGTQHGGLVDEARVTARRNRDRFNLVADEVDKSAAKLREAEMNLLSAVQAGRVSTESIDSYATQIEDFVKLYKILRDR
jgi:hypothetical protein